MKINNIKQNVRFGEALTTRERKKGDKLKAKAMKILDLHDIILITPEASLPSNTNKNIGMGQINSKDSYDFFKFMKSYTGMNIVKVLPQGNYKYKKDGYYGAYGTSALNLGIQLINLEELTTDEYGSILSSNTFNKVIEKNKTTQKDSGLANFENIVLDNSPFNEALKESYENFKKSDNTNVRNLKKEFENYKKDYQDILEPMGIFKVLTKKYNSDNFELWDNIDKNLYNKDLISEDTKNKRITEIKSKYEDDLNFLYFKEFLAEKNLAKARKNINKDGLKLMGDCLVGFSKDEQWAHPKAFANANICSPNWGIKALDFTTICDNNSESNKLIRKKVALFAKRYDAIRLDVGWGYTSPILYCKTEEQKKSLEKDYNYDDNINGYRLKNPLNDKLLNIIEQEVKTVKGDKFDKNDLIYEVEAGGAEFSVYDWSKHCVIPAFQNRKIVQSTCYMDEKYTSIDAIENQMHVPRDNYVLMVGNHDHLALNALAQGIDNDSIFRLNGDNVEQKKNAQYPVLSKELKLDEETLKKDKNEFIKAKFAHIFLAKNVKLFFMDVFGRLEQFDSQRRNSSKNYRYTIPANYEEAFHTAIQNGNGLNIYSTLAKSMKAKGLDKKNQSLYNQLNKLGEKLYKKGVKTEAEANKLAKGELKKAIGIILMIISPFLAIGSGLLLYLNKKNNKETNNNKIIEKNNENEIDADEV